MPSKDSDMNIYKDKYYDSNNNNSADVKDSDLDDDENSDQGFSTLRRAAAFTFEKLSSNQNH
jgi:hypothetical protein